MKVFVLPSLLLLIVVLGGGRSENAVDHFPKYFYQDLGCTKKDGASVEYDCPDLSQKNDTCQFQGKTLKFGDRVDEDVLKGSCNADCHCGYEGKITCAHYDCFERIKPGCSHFRYSLDSCCPVASVCDSTVQCKVDGESHDEGVRFHLKNTCDVCICEKNFEKKAPFCRPRKCLAQTYHHGTVASYGAPVFSKDDKCCPYTWTSDEGDEIIKIGDTQTNTDSSCKYGNKKVNLGFGFKKSVQPYGTKLQLKCECTNPPFVFCEVE